MALHLRGTGTGHIQRRSREGGPNQQMTTMPLPIYNIVGSNGR